MSTVAPLLTLFASDAPLRLRPSNYPEMLVRLLQGRAKHPLGDLFGLANFGVNYTVLAPGAQSALCHSHLKQDEFIYILSGHPTLITIQGSSTLAPGMCAGFRAGNGNAHHLRNETTEIVAFLEIGDRSSGDEVHYPNDDLAATFINGQWIFSHKDGTPY